MSTVVQIGSSSGLQKAMRRVLLFSCSSGLEDQFTKAFPDHGAGRSMVSQGGEDVRLLPMRLDQEAVDIREHIAQADACIVLMRLVDDPSLARARDVLLLLPPGLRLPSIIAVLREAREHEFKMSCACGQRLLTRDADAGRHGRCPACRKLFLIPSQIGLIRSFLMIGSYPPIHTATIGDDSSCRSALVLLQDAIHQRDMALKSSTMPIQIPTEDISS